MREHPVDEPGEGPPAVPAASRSALLVMALLLAGATAALRR
jgi:hypothetical protein